jgi:hypothetical protein
MNDSIRSFMAEAQGELFRSYRNLEEATAEGGTVILEGDDGGTIYLTCPASIVKCGEEGLRSLLSYLDSLKWADPEMAHIWYEKHATGSRLAGGMGGGIVTEDVWIHPKLAEQGIAEKVSAFLRGEGLKLEKL